MARTTFWNNENFSQLINAIRTNRASTQKLDNYASNLAITMNVNKDKKLPGIKSEAVFDWGQRTYAPPISQSQKAIDATADRWAAMYQQYSKEQAKETAPISDVIEKARADQYKKAALPKYRGIIKEMELGKSLYKNWGDKETAEQINQTIQFDENIIPGGKLYADPETNRLTTTPSSIEMYQYQGMYIPIYRNPAGNLTYPTQMQPLFDELGIQLDMTKLKEVKATTDLPHLLTGETTGYDVTMPPSIDASVKPNGKQLYLDSTTKKIVEYETQTPLFWDKNTGQMTYTENDTPVVADDKTLEYLSGTLQTALTAWGSAQALGALGQPVDPYAVAVKPVTTQDVNRQTQIEYSLTTDENGVETVYLQDNGAPTYLEQTATLGGLPASIGMLTPPNWLGNPQQKLFKDTVTGKMLAPAGFAWVGLMEGANISKQVMSTKIHSLNVKSFFGAGLDAIMANFAVAGTLIYNVGATGVRAIGSLFGADQAATDAENSWKNLQDKFTIAKRNNEVFRSEWMELINVPKAEQTLNAQDEAIQAGNEYAKFVAGTFEGMDKMTDQQKFYLEKTLLKKMNDTKARLDFITEDTQKPLDIATQALVQANVWLQNGQTELAIDDVAKSYENIMIGLDWDGAKAYNKDKSTPIQLGAESWIVGMEGMSDQEINAFQQFVQFGSFDYRLVSDFQRTDMESWQGVNFQFLRDMAEMSVKSGQTMTIAEMYDHLIDVWIPDYLADSRENPGFIKWKETNQQRQTERRNVAYQQMEIANMYLGLASGFEEGTPEYQMYQQTAQQFTQVATNLLIDTFEYDKRAGLVNPYATWTFRLDPDAEQTSMQRIALAELQLGRPLTRNEITEITYIDIDPALELFGEMVFDLNNLILPVIGKAAKAAKLGIVAKAMSPGTKIYKGVKWYTDTKFYKFFKTASMSTTAAKLGQKATDISAAAFKNNPATKEQFVEYINEIAKIVKSTGETTGDVVKNLADALNNPVFKGKVPLRVQEMITQLGKHIDPDEWGRLADRAWDVTKNSYVEQITKKVLKENPGKTMADEVVINTINDRVNKSMASYAGKMNISKEFGSQFRAASLLKNTKKLGARDVIADSFSGWLAQQSWMSGASKYVLGGLETIQSKYMKLWIYATLSRRPAWMIYNFTDNLFRFVMSGVSGNVMSSLNDVGKMMSKSGNASALFKNGLVPPQEVGANFGMQFAHFGKEGLTLEGAGLTPNFLEFASHFKLNYQYNAAGKGFFGKLWAGFQAWPQAINSLNTSIEQGFKSLMWLKIYEKNVAKLNKEAVADVLQNLSELLTKHNVPAETAAKIQAHVQNSWVSSGGNAAKLHDLLKFERSDPKLSGYNIYIPEQLRQAEWFDEEAQRMFVYGVAEKWSEFYGDLAKKGITTITPEHVDEFFDNVVRIFIAEQQVKLQAAWENYRIISSVDINPNSTKYSAAKYKRKLTEDVKDVTKEARKFVLDFDDTKPMSSKQKKTLKSVLRANSIDFEDTDDGLKAGYEQLIKKMNEYDAAKPKPLTVDEIKEVEKKVDDFAKAVSQTELNKAEVDVHSNSSVSDLWDVRAKAEAQTKEFMEKELSTLDAYSALTKEEISSLDSVVRGIIHQTNTMSAKINRFWREVFPGPLMGKVEGMPKTGARWVDYFNRVSFQLENRTSHITTDIMDTLKSGVFKSNTDITAEEIFRMSGIDLLYNENGFIIGIRQLNPITGETETITHPVLVNSFKKITGIEDQAGATKKLVKDFLVEKELPIPDSDYMQQIAFKLKAQSMPTLDEMIKGDVRLDLAIQEGRLKDANVILAEKFRFPMVSENGALLDKVLVNKVRKHAGLVDIKTLDDIDPKKTYEVLNEWYKANSGVTLKEIKDNFKPEMIKAIQNLSNVPRQIAETIYDTIERMGTIIGREMNGKTAEEVWQDILLGVYKGGDLGAVDVVRASDSMMVFNTKVRSYIEKNVSGSTKPKELLDFLTKELGQERVKLLGLDDLLKGKRKLDYDELLKHLDKVERYIVAKPTGENFAWVIEIMDHKQSSLSSITADLLGRNTPDGELALGVKFSKQVGELDEYSKQRLLSWASENDFNFVEFLDGTVETVTPQGVMLGSGSYGVTSFIKDEMGRQQAIIRAFTNANAATALEEFFHAAEAYLPRASQDILDEWARPIAQKLMKENPESGLSLEAWVSEVKAKGFQKTIITKLDAPTPVQEIFNKLRSTLVAIYRKWKDFFEGITIPKNVEEVYVRMLDKDYVAKQVKDVPKPKKPIIPPDIPDVPTQGTLFQQALKKADDTTEILERLRILSKGLDDLITDSVTNLYKVLPVSKPFYLTLTPSTYNYVARTFGVEETKRYLQQMAEILYDMSHGLPVATPKPGTFVLGFNNQDQIKVFTYTLEKYEKQVMTQILNEDEVWSIAPRFITGWGESLDEALQDLDLSVDTYMNYIHNQWKLENTIDKPYAIDDVIEMNEAALYPEIRRGIVEQPLGTQRPNLLMVHSTTEGKLRGALDLGGMPHISGAVIKKGMDIPDYGEIVFIGNKNMVDPTMSPANRVFSADIYSPRMPKIEDDGKTLILNGKKVPYTIENVSEWMKSQIKKGGELAGSGAPKPYSAQTAKALGAREFTSLDEIRQWGKTNLQSYDFMRKYIEEFQTPTLNAFSSRLSDFLYRNNLYTNMVDIEDVISLSILSSYLDGGEKTKEAMIRWIRKYIPESEPLRGTDVKITKQIVPNIEDGKVVGKGVDIIEVTFNPNKSDPGYRIFYSMEEAEAFAKRLQLPVTPIDIPDDLVEQAMNAAKILDFTPTTYFEFKPDRIIDFSEWSGVVLPYDTSQDVVDALKAHGLEVKFYGAYSGNTKDSVIESFFTKENVLFQRAKKDTKDQVNEAWKAFVQSPIFDYGNEKISLKDMWLVFFENEDNLYKAGSKGFANYAAKVADQLEDAGNMEMSAVFRELSDMTKNFTNFIEHKVSPVDALFPKTIDGSPMPLWRMNEALRNYVSSKYLVASEWTKADKAIKLWRESMKANISGSLMEDVVVTPETRAVLDEIASYASGVKNEVDDIANFGGTYKNVTIDPSDAAVNKTNFIMMDYSDNSQFLEAMKQIFPFISYPAKSLGYWTDLIVTHPELVTFYYKYQDFSRAIAVQQGAVASNGDVLPSLKGYVPIMEGLWFNPLAPLFYRFAFPRTEGKPEVDEELPAIQWIAKFFLDDAPIFGLNIGPIPQQILMLLRDPYYPKPGWAFETIRAFFPIDYIPPVWERWMVEKIRKFTGIDQATASKIFPDTGETLSPRVSWSDYLIEREMLIMAREHIETLNTPEDKLDYAKQVVAVYANPNREEEKLWVEARDKMETDQYFRTMGGHMTGLYTKVFTPGQADLQSIRDEINILKASIEDQTLANLFGMSGDPEKRYDEYINTKYNTLDGYFWNALMMSRYVVDPDTEEPLQGQERREEMARQYNVDEQTNLYYQAIKIARDELNQKLSLVVVGNTEAKSEIYKEYFEQLELIKTNPAYALANPDSFLGYKPTARIEKDLRNRFWNEILATKPSYDQDKSYEENKRIELEWQETIPEIAEIALPILEISIINQINESQVYLEDRLKQYPTWIAKIKQEANADGLKQWSKDTATPLDAVWEYYQQNILQPYFDSLEGKNMYEAQAAKLAFEKSYRDPLPEEVIAWIEKEYGKNQFDKTVLMQEIQGKQYMKPEDRLNLGKSDIELSTDELWQIQASLGPGNSPVREDYMKAFRMLGGDESDWDFFIRAGGDVDAFRDPEDYTNLLRTARLAAEKIGLTPATESQLLEFSEAKKSQEEFRIKVEKQLGEDIWTLQNYYYGLSTEERKQFRTENPDEYFKISQYYTLKDQYAAENSIWAAYYHPDYEVTVTSSGSGYSSSGYSGGYSSSGRGYSATYQEYKRSLYANTFLPQGRRGARTGMDLIVYGLGKGGVTKQPWWPQELLDKLHEQMVAQIQSGQITQAGLDYLNSVAQTNPEYSKIIRDNIKLMIQPVMGGGKQKFEMK